MVCCKRQYFVKIKLLTHKKINQNLVGLLDYVHQEGIW